MNTTKIERKEKAIELMKKLDIYKPYIKGFKENDEVCFFEGFGGFWAWQDEELQSKIKEIEEIFLNNENFINKYMKDGNFYYLQQKQLRHEIIHAFLAESGLQSNFKHSDEFGHDETMVDWIAIQWHKIEKVFDQLGI